MKFLIWFATIFIATILNGILGYVIGFKAGYFIFYLAVYFVATRLCKSWDEHKAKKKAEAAESIAGQSGAEMPKLPTEAMPQIAFCRKCGANLVEGGEFCPSCGTKVLETEQK